MRPPFECIVPPLVTMCTPGGQWRKAPETPKGGPNKTQANSAPRAENPPAREVWQRLWPQHQSIRRSLVRNLVLLIGLTAGAILFLSWSGSIQSVRALSQTVIVRTADRTEAELARFFDPVVTVVTAGKSLDQTWAASARRHVQHGGAHDPAARAGGRTFTRLLSPRTDGQHLILFRGEDTWTTRMTHPDAWGPRAQWERWDGNPDAHRSVE